jgi:hypothetical protein
MLVFGTGPGLPLPAWIGVNAPFWKDLTALRKAIPERESRSSHPYRLIAVTWHTDLGFEAEERQDGKFLGPDLSPTTPEHRDARWRFLGFDITDGGSLELRVR